MKVNMFPNFIKNSFIALLMLSHASMVISMEQAKPSWWQKVLSYFWVKNDERLLKKYKIPKELEEQLNDAAEHDDQFKREVNKLGYFVCKCPNNLPCYIKGWNDIPNQNPLFRVVPKRRNISRIENLEKLEKIKNSVAPDDVVLPTKFLWHQKNRALELNDFNYFIVSEELEAIEKEVDRRSLEGIDDKQLDRFCWFLRKSGFYANHDDNVFFTYDYSGKKFWEKNFKKKIEGKKRIAIIDTETQNDIGNNFSVALHTLVKSIKLDSAFAHPILAAHYRAAKNEKKQ